MLPQAVSVAGTPAVFHACGCRKGRCQAAPVAASGSTPRAAGEGLQREIFHKAERWLRGPVLPGVSSKERFIQASLASRRLRRCPVPLPRDSPQRWDEPPRARAARRAAGGAGGKRGLSPLPLVLCQEEERKSLRRNNLPVRVTTPPSLHLSFPRKVILSSCLTQIPAPQERAPPVPLVPGNPPKEACTSPSCGNAGIASSHVSLENKPDKGQGQRMRRQVRAAG